MAKTYKTEKRQPKVIEFELDGEAFTFTAPKRSALLIGLFRGDVDYMGPAGDLIATRDQFNWLGAGLSDEQGQRVLDRMADPDDDLEWSNVQEIIHDLMAEVSGRPTKRQSG